MRDIAERTNARLLQRIANADVTLPGKSSSQNHCRGFLSSYPVHENNVTVVHTVLQVLARDARLFRHTPIITVNDTRYSVQSSVEDGLGWCVMHLSPHH